MAIKDETMTTAFDDDGNEYISEMEATITGTEADGTEFVAEVTTTADADDPTDVESEMTITETAPDGTETVTEVVVNEDGAFIVEEDSMFENAVEAIFGVEIEDEMTQILDADGNPVGEYAESLEADADFEDYSEVYVAGSDNAPVSVEFNLGDEEFGQTAETFDSPDTLASSEPFAPTMETIEPTFTETYQNTTFDPYSENVEIDDTDFSAAAETFDVENENYEVNAAHEEANQQALEQEAHAQSATEAQQAADDFVAAGDYAAASQAREVAENEAWEAGDDSMLGAYDAQDFANAADKQELAAEYEQQQAEHAQAGDYEAAREDAANAAYATSDADWHAGGDDHTGQADKEFDNMSNAVWHEERADDQLENAAWHAEQGNADAAETALDNAAWEQATADEFGDRGEHGATGADFDPSSVVETGGSYESTFDDNMADIDTGFDSGMDAGFDSGLDAGFDDMSVDTGFDSGVDTSIDSGFDSGMDDV